MAGRQHPLGKHPHRACGNSCVGARRIGPVGVEGQAVRHNAADVLTIGAIALGVGGPGRGPGEGEHRVHGTCRPRQILEHRAHRQLVDEIERRQVIGPDPADGLPCLQQNGPAQGIGHQGRLRIGEPAGHQATGRLRLQRIGGRLGQAAHDRATDGDRARLIDPVGDAGLERPRREFRPRAGYREMLAQGFAHEGQPVLIQLQPEPQHLAHLDPIGDRNARWGHDHRTIVAARPVHLTLINHPDSPRLHGTRGSGPSEKRWGTRGACSPPPASGPTSSRRPPSWPAGRTSGGMSARTSAPSLAAA